MRFKATAINPKGRNKYGEYLSTGNITKKVIKTSYYGDSSNNDISGGGDGGGTIDDDHSKDDNFVLDLSTMSYDFDGSMLDVSSATKTINVIGYRGRTKADTYVGDISTMVTSDTYSISGIPESGMSISVDDNGTPYTKINITITSALTEAEGVLMIPISINLKTIPGEPLDDDISAWNSNSGDCVTEVFEFDWRVLTMSVSGDIYILDLTNEAATINCDADGHVLPGAARPHCKAILYHGISAMTSGVTFSITTPVEQNVQGVAIDNNGNLTFGSNFDFDGTDLEITVIANYSLVTRGAIMTVSKVKPGADGTPATSYWLVLSANAVRVSNNIATPNNITAQAMMQVGEDEPTTATGVSIYYGFDTEYPSTAYPSSGVTVIISRAYISFVLKKGNVIVDGVETVPIVVNGADGVSPYRLDLSNDNASINCDSAWNILPTAYRPRCTAKLWQGTNEVTGVTYALSGASCSYSGATIDSTTGVITLGEGSSAEPFWFDKNYTAIEFNVYAYIGQSLVAASVFTISRSIAGTDGADGKSITGVTEHYALSNNGTTAPTSGWTTTIQTPTASLPYLWNYEQIDFSSGAPKTTSPVVIAYYTKDGKGISAITEYYAINDSTVVPPTSWSTSMAVPTAGNPYLWNYEVITYSDGTTASTSPVIIGIRGEKGADGRSITGVTEYYALNNDRNTPPTTGWSTAISSPTESSPFLWNYESIGYNSGMPTTTTPVIIAYYTKDGRGVSVITEYYAINNSTGTTPTSWSTTMVVPTDDNRYLWNYEKITYTDGTTANTTAVIIGIKGENGVDGRSITGVTEYYARNNNSSTAPTSGWTTTMSNPTESLPFLWNYESIGYNTGNPTTTTPVIIARYTKDGKGVSAITEYYAINNSTVTAPTTWHTTVQIPTDSNPYLWNYELVTYTDGSTSSTTPVIIGIKGVDGASGESAVSYWLEMDYTDVKVTSAGTYTPATITITKKKQVGGSAPVTTSDGVIKYGYDTVAPSTTYSNGIKTTGATNYITVHYLVDNVIRDNETILVIHDGKDGQSIEGRQGAAVRGPYLWDNRASRSGLKWCNGSGATGTEESQFIDVMIKDGTYYYCKTTYVESGQAWSSVQNNWVASSTNFDFVAANLILANNAKISAFTGNDIYVMSGNTVVGGMQGSGNTFCWAGANEPANATFKVDYDGTIHASKGEFSGYVRVPYVNYTGLATTTTTLNGSTISGKDAGENAYIMKVGGSTSDKLILPEPTESLAGMTYRIIVGSYMELYIKGADGTAKHFNIAQTSHDIKKIIARYGYIELTCMLAPFGTRGVVWAWAVTAFNGNLELYYVAVTSQGSQVLFDKAITPIYGMSLVTGDTYTVKYINADATLPSDKADNTLYFTRN